MRTVHVAEKNVSQKVEQEGTPAKSDLSFSQACFLDEASPNIPQETGFIKSKVAELRAAAQKEEAEANEAENTADRERQESGMRYSRPPGSTY